MYSSEGVVIRSDDYGEADRFFTVFSKDFGKIRVFGKGIRKIKAKLRGGLQILNHIHLEFVQGKHFFTATEAVNIDSFILIKNDPEKLGAVFYLFGILDQLVKEGKDERIWLLVSKIIKKIEEPKFSGPKLSLLIHYFEWNLLDILGYHPELYKCVNCRAKLKEENLFFSSLNGGILCSNCGYRDKESIMIDVNTLKLLRLIMGRKREVLEKLKIDDKKSQIDKITKYYLEGILGERINLI